MAEKGSSAPSLEIPLDFLAATPYNLAVAYPQPEPKIVQERIEQLDSLGIEKIIFRGHSMIGRLPILGKGCVGVVVGARMRDGEKLAVKIRRTDANRPDMKIEANLQETANWVNVGPRFYDQTKDVLAMQLVEGRTLPLWASAELNKGEARRTLCSLLEQCYALDRIGLDHGELSRAHKNILITVREPFIVDFESSSFIRKANNLTSLIQYLFFSKAVAKAVRSAVTVNVEHGELIERLRAYKTNCDEERYEDLVSILGL